MSNRIKQLVETMRQSFGGVGSELGARVARFRIGSGALALGALAASAYLVVKYPPLQSFERDEIGVRSNTLTGGASLFREGAALIVPGVHQVRRISLRDRTYRPTTRSSDGGHAPFQSVEGLSLGVDVAVRYGIDTKRIESLAKSLPVDIDADIVEPAMQGVLYKTLSRYTVREIFSTKRAEIQQTIEAELAQRLASDGLVLRTLTLGKVELPADYKAGMERLLAEELASEKMRYTLDLKDKQVKQSELEAQAEKVRREKAAEAAGEEQIIAAKAQAEAMKHILPFKQKQIEQRGLEAEAEKISRIKSAEGMAQARRIEAAGEADSRQKLADAEAYRQERIGKIASEQLARDGALISKNPLLIQKTMADKLSDKISVIIAPPPSDGGFIGSTLLGGGNALRATATEAPAVQQETTAEGQ